MGANVIGYDAVPVGVYQRPAGDGHLGLEHELLFQVAVNAVRRAGLDKGDIDGIVVAHPGDHTKQGYFHTFTTSYFGLTGTSNVIQVLGNGMTGGHAFDEGYRLVASGESRCVLVLGAHFETGIKTADHLDYSIRLTGDVDFQSIFGLVPIAWYAMDAMRYMHEHGVSRADLAHVAVKSRAQAMHNPLAQYREPLTLEDVLAQRLIVDPLGLLEVPGRADGAVALVIANDEIAAATDRRHVRIGSRGFYHEGQHQTSDHPTDALAYAPLRRAADDALARSSLSMGDISLFQLYAPCTIVEIAASEALGLFEKGKGWRAAADGTTRSDGRVPINTSGGCLSRGHPPEVSPLYDIVELCEQLLGRAGGRQVPDARIGLTACELGKYNAALVHILEAAA